MEAAEVASNYEHAMSSGAAHIYIKRVHLSRIDIEDVDYEKDLSVCSRFWSFSLPAS